MSDEALRARCAKLITEWRDGTQWGPWQAQDAYADAADALEQALRDTVPAGPVCLDCGAQYAAEHVCQRQQRR